MVVVVVVVVVVAVTVTCHVSLISQLCAVNSIVHSEQMTGLIIIERFQIGVVNR